MVFQASTGHKTKQAWDRTGTFATGSCLTRHSSVKARFRSSQADDLSVAFSIKKSVLKHYLIYYGPSLTS